MESSTKIKISTINCNKPVYMFLKNTVTVVNLKSITKQYYKSHFKNSEKHGRNFSGKSKSKYFHIKAYLLKCIPQTLPLQNYDDEQKKQSLATSTTFGGITN